MLEVEKGTIVSPAVVVVTGDRITAVNPATTPDGARTIDLGDVTLAPGFIDLHTHLTLDIEPGWQYQPVEWTAADYALRGARNAVPHCAPASRRCATSGPRASATWRS